MSIFCELFGLEHSGYATSPDQLRPVSQADLEKMQLASIERARAMTQDEIADHRARMLYRTGRLADKSKS